MGQTLLSRGIFFSILGVFFVFLAIEDVNTNQFGFFTYLLILLATMDIGTGIRLMFTHFKLKNSQKH